MTRSSSDRDTCLVRFYRERKPGLEAAGERDEESVRLETPKRIWTYRRAWELPPWHCDYRPVAVAEAEEQVA
jgi:hypothetical protein